MHTPGSAFTPTTTLTSVEVGGTDINNSTSQTRSTPRRQISSPGTTGEELRLASHHRYGRMRSTSASDTTASPPHPPSSQRQRRPSSSARTSPVDSPLMGFTPVGETTPHRIQSVPQLSRVSPIMYGYGYQNASRQEADDAARIGILDGYFSLPPLDRRPPADSSPLPSDEMPPPYTASQVELQSLMANYTPHNGFNHDQPSRAEEEEEAEEEGEDEEDILSFSTDGRNHSSHVIDNQQQGLRQRRNHEELIQRGNVASHLPPQAKESLVYIRIRHFILIYLLQPLRLLAAVPGCIGTFWLLRNAIVLAWLRGSIWQHDGSPSALEFGLASLWSMATAYHANSFTTLLLRRWLHYYSILPSFIRLIALQAICWPLVRLTLYIFGSKNPLAAWVVISTTTATSDTVARWVVSNITEEGRGAASSQGDSSPSITSRNRKRKKRTKSSAMAFWRAIMGGPTTDESIESFATNNRSTQESEVDSDVDYSRLSRRNGQAWDSNRSGREDSFSEAILPRSQRVARFFHWDVALRRNVLPIAVLAYLSLLLLLLEQVRHRG